MNVILLRKQQPSLLCAFCWFPVGQGPADKNFEFLLSRQCLLSQGLDWPRSASPVWGEAACFIRLHRYLNAIPRFQVHVLDYPWCGKDVLG